MKQLNISKLAFLLCILAGLFQACEQYELPEAGSIPDATPPAAEFAVAVSEADNFTINFTNNSISATDYEWNFGDGNTSTAKNPSNTYAAVGTYTVTLTASDKLGQTNTTTQEVAVEEATVFIPVIREAGFEDNSLDDGSGDGRDSWRNEMGGVIQITSSPVFDGSQAAKMPSAGDRVGFQMLTVASNTDYVVTFYYTMKTDPEGSLTVAILDSESTDLANVPDAIIESVTLTDQTDANAYVEVRLPFNSGNNTEVGIFFHNEGVECRLDNFDIDVP
ncbi:MAG: PKD domain-containing protein [Bacteroidota bacterium]